MKIVSYKAKGNEFSDYRVGFSLGNRIVDLQATYKNVLLAKGEEDAANGVSSILPANPDEFYALGKVALARGEEAFEYATSNEANLSSFEREEVVLGPPVPNPSKIICIGTNYRDHVMEMKSEIPDFPVLFAKFNNALIGPEDAIEKSEKTSKLDYEVEFAVVIGKKASGVKREHALDYIAGYTIGNDISARDLQKRTPQWLQGKSLDRSTPIGPWLVTTNEMPDPSNVSVKSSVNGEVRQDSNTEHLIFDIPFLIEFISDLMTLEPGDIILTGTPGGVGMGMEPPKFLEIGDVVTLEVEGIGKLENKIIAKEE